jgi:hypothetical protein
MSITNANELLLHSRKQQSRTASRSAPRMEMALP